MCSFDVDLVYSWVDGNDPEWLSKRNALIGESESDSAVNCDGRYANNEELKYSIRTAARYAPWIRNIFIVTDNQTPSWLDIKNPKIKIIDHRDFIPAEYLPTFNSVVIEHHLHNIPGLAEHFLYANDDMFFNRPVSKSDFFTSEGMPVMRLNRRLFRKLTLWIENNLMGKTLSYYNHSIMNAAECVKEKFGKTMYGKPHHNIDAFRKSDYAFVADTFRDALTPTFSNHVRCDNDVQRCIYSYVPLILKRARLKYVTQNTSFRFHIENPHHYKRIKKKNPMLLCVNDSQYAAPADRLRIREWMEKRYPEKCCFEI